MRYLSIKNYAAHQHYKDRRPPWIKLHAAVLDDYAFGCLQDASKAHLMLLWVLASKLDNRIPWDEVWLAKQLGATEPVNIEVLVSHGFVIVEQSDSAPLADCARDAEPETEAETETEPPLLSVRERFLNERLTQQSSRRAWVAELEAWEGGMNMPPGSAPTRVEIDRALSDYLLNTGPASPPPAAASMRAYVARVVREWRAEGGAAITYRRSGSMSMREMAVAGAKALDGIHDDQ